MGDSLFMINKNLFKIKKADVSVTLLVFMTLALCGLAIFSFYYYNGRDTQNVMDYNQITQFYIEQQNFEVYLKDIALETFEDISIHQQDKLSEDYFIERFKYAYSTYLDNANAPESFKQLPMLSQINNNSNYVIKISANHMDFKLMGFNFVKSLELVSSSDIQNLGLKKDIIFAIDLKTPSH